MAQEDHIEPVPEQMVVTDLHHATYVLKQPLVLTIEREPDGYLLSNHEVSVYAFEETMLAAEAEWKHRLTSLYRAYRETDNEHLTRGAKIFKDMLATYVGERSCQA